MVSLTIKHFHQPTGNTCGPTCLYMINDTIGVKEYSIEMIADFCGTDWEVGTPPDRMKKGLEILNLKYVEYQFTPRPYELLKQVINDGNIPILRTITNGQPHWIIVDGYDLENYQILDPWLGEIQYTEKQLDKIWKLREYQFFEIITK